MSSRKVEKSTNLCYSPRAMEKDRWFGPYANARQIEIPANLGPRQRKNLEFNMASISDGDWSAMADHPYTDPMDINFTPEGKRIYYPFKKPTDEEVDIKLRGGQETTGVIEGFGNFLCMLEGIDEKEILQGFNGPISPVVAHMLTPKGLFYSLAEVDLDRDAGWGALYRLWRPKELWKTEDIDEGPGHIYIPLNLQSLKTMEIKFSLADIGFINQNISAFTS